MAKKLSLKEQFKALKHIPAFLKLMWKSNPTMASINVVLRVLKSVLPITMLYVGKLIIDEIVVLSRQSDPDLEMLIWYVAIEFGLAIMSDIFNRVIALIDSLLGDLFANETSVRLMKHASKLDLDQFENSEFYDKLERARRQTLGRTVLMSQVLSQFQDLVTMLSLGVGLVIFNPLLIVLLIIAVIPAFLGENHFNERTYSLVHGWTPMRRELDYLRYTGASDVTAKELKVFGLSDFLTGRFKRLSDEYYDLNKGISQKRAFWGVVFSGLGTAAYYGTYGFIIYETVNGQLTLGDLTFLSGSFLRFKTLLEGALNRFSKITEGAMYLKDFFEFFEIQPKIATNQSSLPIPRPIKQGFEFENVSFKYENTETYAVRNLSFKLEPGEKMALVGENGAGKTTLVKLLARLYDPTEGRILLDGVDLRDYDPEDFNKNVGVIFQDFVRFNFTAGLNVAIGQIEDKEQQELIEQASVKSLADQVIESLPDRYDQMIGKRFEGGVDLSGGQWQKIALGRAYMRSAQMLILDEPTAALDARAEHEVFKRFAELTKDKTAILISHRFSTVRMATKILVLENGGIAEIGSHSELLEKNGIYANLFNLQASGYR
ncbi:MAG: ABC transporter ATP-binding protein/permease [bacterium]|nr:ABC transporter ATP-binding protein/permease [bacterium]